MPKRAMQAFDFGRSCGEEFTGYPKKSRDDAGWIGRVGGWVAFPPAGGNHYGQAVGKAASLRSAEKKAVTIR